MLGDEALPAESDGRGRTTSGPRHAAPRKSLLTKLHMPAGKAVALAAMPTAVLMGMGFTPHLAQADELPKSPYKPGPCVTQSDAPAPSATDKAADKAKGDDAGKTDAGKTDDKPKPDPTTSPSATPHPSTGSATPEPTATSSADTGKPDTQSQSSPSAAPSPSPTKSTNPLDPLGLGDLLNGLLGGGKKTDPTPAPTTTSPTPAPTTSAPKPDPSPSGGSDAGGAKDSGKKAAKDAGKSTTDAAKKAAKALKDATATPKPTASPSPSSTAGSDGKQGYPCPTYDAKALDDAKTEGGIPLLPDQPWVLKSSILTLHGLSYDGIVQVKTASGEIKDVLKFTTSGIDIGDLDQFVVGANGKGHTEVKAAKGSTSTITGGTTTLYTESLSGNLLGLIPITFTPKAPPPLTLPELFFTDVTVINAGQFGGNLHVPGMQVLPDQP